MEENIRQADERRLKVIPALPRIETGKELWIFDPKSTRVSEHRGVSYWPGDSRTGPRIILATEARLIALDATSGKPALEFGDNGEVNLRIGVADDYPNAHYAITSPPAI